MAVPTYRAHMTAVTTPDRHAYFKRRADAIPGCALSQYLFDVLEYYLKIGAPPVNERDKAIPVPKFIAPPEPYAALKREKRDWKEPLTK